MTEALKVLKSTRRLLLRRGFFFISSGAGTMRRTFSCTVTFILCSFPLIVGCGPSTAPIVKIAPAAAHWIANYLLGKAMDGVWDAMTGKPDVALLEQRIRALENDSQWRPEYEAPVDDLMNSISSDTTADEYHKLVLKALSQIEAIDQRLGVVEKKVGEHEVRISQLEYQAAMAYTSPPVSLGSFQMPTVLYQGRHPVGVFPSGAPNGLAWMDDPIMRCRWMHVGGPPVIPAPGQQLWGDLYFDATVGRHFLTFAIIGGFTATYAAQ